MTDIVERLRTWREDTFPPDPSKEAADEIESLRTLLARCRAERDELARKYYTAVNALADDVDTEMQPLPDPFIELHREISPHVYAAWAAQMRAYAAQAVAAERERCAMEVWYLVQQYQNDPDDDGVEHWLREAERAIRARGA